MTILPPVLPPAMSPTMLSAPPASAGEDSMVGVGLSTGVVSTLMVGVTNTSGLALPCLDIGQ